MTEPHFPLGPLAGEFYDNGRKLVLLRSFAFRDGDGQYIVVPKHATSDFNSTPRLLWSVFPPWHHPEAGVVHDFLYRNGGQVQSHPDVMVLRPYTRAEADAIHRRILELTGASWFLRWTSHRALRLFGGGAWQEAA